MCLYKWILVLLTHCVSYIFGFQQIHPNDSVINLFEDSGFSSFSYERCQRLCVYSSSCVSIDWNKATRVCRLNRDQSEQKKNTSTFSVSVDNIAFKTGPCMRRPCNSGHVCVPVTSSTDFRCLPTGETTSTRTTTATPTTAKQMTAATTMTVTEATQAAETTTMTVTEATQTKTTAETTNASTSAATTITTTKLTTSKPDDPCKNISFTNGSFLCDVGCGFDFDNQLCRMMNECLYYLNTFEMYPGKYIRGRNVHQVTPDVCEAECIATNCSTYEIRRNVCGLQEVFWYGVDEDRRMDSDEFQLFQRNCGTWPEL